MNMHPTMSPDSTYKQMCVQTIKIDCMLKTIPLFLGFFILPFIVSGQCGFTPTVEGDTLLCPNSSGVLHTQPWDSVQWYKRSFNGDEAEPIPGATDTFIEVNSEDILNHYSVEVSRNGCTERSEEVLLDGLAFLLPTVIQSGEFGSGPEGNIVLCRGDSVVFEFSYNANVRWFKNGVEVPGTTDSTLVVYEEGSYTAEGAPERCPEFIQALGVVIEVVEKDRAAVEPVIDKKSQVALELTNPGQFTGFQWYYEDSLLVFNQDTIHPQQDGDYRLFAQDEAYCPEWSDPFPWNVTAVDDPRLPEYSLYPQPVENVLHLRLPADNNWSNWEIINAGGRMVMKGAASNEIQLHSLPEGWYLFRISGENQWHYSPLIKQ